MKKIMIMFMLTLALAMPMSALAADLDGQEEAGQNSQTEAVSEQSVISSGECGEKLTWSLDDEGLLTISGEGEMADYDADSSLAPWSENKEDVKSILIEDKVTSIGAYAFYDLSKVESLVIPANVKSLGDHAFYNCEKMASVYILNKECEIEDDENTFPASASIYGYENSTAESYAKNYERTFTAHDGNNHFWTDWKELSSSVFEAGGQERSCQACGKVEMKSLAMRIFAKKTKQLDFSDVLYGKLTYKTANKKIATVSAKGLVKGIKAGTTKITVKSAGDGTHAASEISFTVTVPTTITSATLSKTSFVYNELDQRPKIMFINKNKKLVEGTDYQIEWTEAEAVKPGSYHMKITGIGKYKGTVKKTFKITKATQKITVSALKVPVKGSKKLEVTAKSDRFSYKSSNKKIATVDADGTIYGVKAGSVYITIKASANDCYKATSKKVKVQIVKKAQEFAPSIDIDPMADGQFYLFAGKSAKITAEGIGKITFAGSNAKLAKVSADGTVTGKKEGSVKITVKAAGNSEYSAATKQITIHVITKNVQIISCENYTKSITDIGSTFNLEAELSVEEHALSYSSSNPEIVSVDENGNVSINKTGKVTITISTPETDDYYGATKKVVVDVQKLAQTITYDEIDANVTETDIPLNAQTSGDGKISYVSSDRNIASVDENGNVNAMGTGTTTIKITAAETETYAKATVEAKVTFKSDYLMWNKNKVYRILMIGNSKTLSRTHAQRFPNYCYMVKEAMQQQGYKIDLDILKMSGASLAQFNAEKRATLYKGGGKTSTKTLSGTLKAKKYDIIILQEESKSSAIANNKSYRHAAISIAKKAIAKNPNCAIMVRDGWPFKRAKNRIVNCNANAEYIVKYVRNHLTKNCKVIYEGNIVTREAHMYADSIGHASYRGKYATACLMTTTLTGEKVTTSSSLCLKYLKKNKMASSKEAYYKLMDKLHDLAWEYYQDTKN